MAAASATPLKCLVGVSLKTQTKCAGVGTIHQVNMPVQAFGGTSVFGPKWHFFFSFFLSESRSGPG